MDDGYNFASRSPQTVTDAFGTPPGRTLIDRFHERSNLPDDLNPLRTPTPTAQQSSHPTFETRTWWQTTIWAVIVIGVILGLILL
jgi:hypothetical protein